MTMKKTLITIALLAAGTLFGQVIKISQLPQTTTVTGSELILLTYPGQTNKAIVLSNLSAQIGSSRGTNQPALVVIGDSMSDYDGLPGARGWVGQLITNPVSAGWAILNAAKSGDHVSLDVANWNSRYYMLTNLQARSNSWAIVFKGFNDSGVSPATVIEGHLATVYANLHSYGFRVMAMTVPYSGVNAILAELNQWILTNGVPDMTMDLQSMGPTFSDGVHPTVAFNEIIQHQVAAELPMEGTTMAGASFYGGIRVHKGNDRDGYSRLDGDTILGYGAKLGFWDAPSGGRYSTFISAPQDLPLTSDLGMAFYTFGVLRMYIHGDTGSLAPRPIEMPGGTSTGLTNFMGYAQLTNDIIFPTNQTVVAPTLALGEFRIWNSNGLGLFVSWNTNGTTSSKLLAP